MKNYRVLNSLRWCKEFTAVVAILILTACGGGKSPAVLPPTPAPVPIDVVAALFRTNARNIGPATVFDSVRGDQIIRVTYTPTSDKETHSNYQRSATCGTAGGIRVVSEETWNRPPTHLIAVQDYAGHPCWINALIINPGDPVLHTHIPLTGWTWTPYDAAGNPGPQASGQFTDDTWLTPAPLSLKEFYDDPGSVSQPYCQQGNYDGLGLASLAQAACGPTVAWLHDPARFYTAFVRPPQRSIQSHP